MAIGIHGAGAHPADKLTARLRARGYDATRYQTVLDRTKGKSPEEVAAVVMGAYAGKLPISALTDNYDLVLSVGNVNGLMQPVERVSWPATKGTYDIPWYVPEIPTSATAVSYSHLDGYKRQGLGCHLRRRLHRPDRGRVAQQHGGSQLAPAVPVALQPGHEG